MRRITFTIVVTAAILVLLFSYRTSTQGPTATAASSGGAHIVSGPATTTSAPPDPASPASSDATAGNQITIPSTASKATSTSSAVKSKAQSPTTTSKGAHSAVTTTVAPTTAPVTTSVAPTPTASKNVVVDGAAEMTRYGAVQVEVTITGGKITDVQAIQYPNQEPRDQEINSNALPILHDQVISAQSAQIDGVSGATYTTEGFVASLQSALDAANFK